MHHLFCLGVLLQRFFNPWAACLHRADPGVLKERKVEVVLLKDPTWQEWLQDRQES